MEKREFVGPDQRQAFFRTLDAVEGGTLSPGGAAAVIRFTRQGIWRLIRAGHVRSWTYQDRPGGPVDLAEVSLRDVVAWAVDHGHITSYEQVGLRGEIVRAEVERALFLAVDVRKRALVD